MRKVLVYMPVSVHPIQAALWKAISCQKVKEGMSLREIGAVVGETSPQKIKHHLEQLRILGTIDWSMGMYRFPNH